MKQINEIQTCQNREMTIQEKGSTTEQATPLSFQQRYVKRRVLGRGSMGVVFECYDRMRGQYVACKTIPSNAPQRHHESLLAEAKVLSMLQHPGILPLFDVGTLPDGRPYYTMQRVQGTTLEIALKQGLLTLQEGIDALRQASDALAYAHDKGVIHCDLKPANILRDHQGHIYLIDWGTSEAHIPSQSLQPRHGQDKKYIINGTPLYIAPEVLRGETPSPQADQYALGVILYELLTGSHPFYDDNILVLFQQVCCTDVIPPQMRVPEVEISPYLESMCIRLLSKFSGTRFADCSELSRACSRWLGTQEMPQTQTADFPQWFAAPAI